MKLRALTEMLHESCCAACAAAEEEDQEHTPTQVKHCVRAVGKKTKSLNRAFAICVAAGQKRGTLKKGSIQSTAKGKKADAAKAKEPDNDSKVGDYEKMLKKNKRSESTMPLRSDMLRLLGETDAATDFQARRDAGPTSTGVTNKTPAKKTPIDKVKPPRSDDSAGDTGEPSATASPKNSPAKKTPMKAGVSPPNVRGAVEDMKRLARIYAGVDSKYELPAADRDDSEEKSYLESIKTEESEDPILKLAVEGQRSGRIPHPFE